jgi:hypothetical protein
MIDVMDIKLKVIEAACGITALSEVELLERLERLYIDGMKAGADALRITTVAKMRPLRARFETKVLHAENGCRLWTGALKDNGYGYFRISEELGMISAHKAAWLIYNDDIPLGLNVLHSCDVRRCVWHLWLGTQKQNQIDMANKGRVYSAAAHGLLQRGANGRFMRAEH